MAIKIASFPMNSIVIFQFVMLVITRYYQRVHINVGHFLVGGRDSHEFPLQDGQWEQALWLFSLFSTMSTCPDSISYSAAMSALEKGGRFQKFPKLLEKSSRRNCL